MIYCRPDQWMIQCFTVSMWRYLVAILCLGLVADGRVDQSGPTKTWRRPIGRGGTRHVVREDIDYNNPDIRELCPEGEDPPSNRVYTHEEVAALRVEMAAAGLKAYLIPYEDEHMTSPSDYDKRLKYISGFAGSSGFAWVTHDANNKEDYAAVWTDGRYWEQVDQEMDCNWLLMKEDFDGYPGDAEWIIEVMENESGNVQVGADPRLIATDKWLAYIDAFNGTNVNFVEVQDELIDKIWTDGRTPRPNNPVHVHELEYTNEAWDYATDENGAKVESIRAELEVEGKDVLVMHALDETAWLFNIRGTDRDTAAYFYSYAMLFRDDNYDNGDSSIRLYLVNHVTLLADNGLAEHLNTGLDGSCTGRAGYCVNVREYDDIMTDIEALDTDNSVNSIWVDSKSSYAIYNSAGTKRYVDMSPVQLIKSIKNPTERRRYRECQVRDSAYVVEFLTELEEAILNGEELTEIDAVDRLNEIRGQDSFFKMPSFDTISAVGPNSAVIHYMPTEHTDTQIVTDQIYLLDSGGQYYDGTTDVTRTFHFGSPRDIEVEAYTRTLIGVIDLATTVWPDGLLGSDIDARSRAAIWEAGWDFNHGTGHGIGYFLGVHEGPGSIRMGYNPDHRPMYDGMFFSDEPGYYEEADFGVRLESIVEVVIKGGVANFNGKDYLTFNAVTLVPFEPKLIDYDMLTFRHREWLNEYNRRCREETGAFLLDELDNQDAYDWLMIRTEHIPEEPNWGEVEVGGAMVTVPNFTVFLLVAMVACFNRLGNY